MFCRRAPAAAAPQAPGRASRQLPAASLVLQAQPSRRSFSARNTHPGRCTRHPFCLGASSPSRPADPAASTAAAASAAAADSVGSHCGSGGHNSAATRRGSAVRCAALPEAVGKAVEALKEAQDKPTDREVAAAATAAAVATASTLKHSKTALGYLTHEAPLCTWLPLLLCAAAAAAGVATARRQLMWAAAGGLAAFTLSIWQVLVPLVRRFQSLRNKLLENERAAKQRLDTAAAQLRKMIRKRGASLQDAAQAKHELRQLQQQLEQSAAESARTGNSAGGQHGADGGSQAAEWEAEVERLKGLIEERQKHDQRLAGILNNALNAAAVPNMGMDDAGHHTDMSSDLDMGDGYNERPVDRSSALELAAALQSRVDALRRQAQEATAQHEEVEALRAQLQERGDSLAALQAQLELSKADARRLPQVQQYAKDLEWQLLQKEQAERERLEAAGREAGASAATDAAYGEEGAAAQGEAVPSAHHGQAGEQAGANGAVPAPPRRGRGRPRGSGRCQLASAGTAGMRQLEQGARAAQGVAAQLAGLRRQLASAEHHLEDYDRMVHSLESKLEELRHHEGVPEDDQAAQHGQQH